MTDRKEIEVLFDVAVLGKQVDAFMKSDIGKFVLGRAQNEYDDAIRALKKCPSHDAHTIRQLQSDIQRAESLKDWLEQALIAGLKATFVLEDRQED